MKLHRLRSLLLVLALCAPLALPACASVQTHVSAVADVANAGAKVEASAHVIFDAAKTANAMTNPTSGQPLLARANLDIIAIAVNKTGHLGLDLDNALGDYNAAKAAGKDVSAIRLVVQKVLSDLATVLADVGKAIPPGLLATIDQAVASIASVLMLVKGAVGL